MEGFIYMNYNFIGRTPTSPNIGKASIGTPKSGDFGVHITPLQTFCKFTMYD
jgi:hypothetical protein